jgi:hypothetical protein
MALFTDGPIAATEDLTSQDSAVLTVASTEGIDLSKKLGLAMDELAMELGGLLPVAGGLNHVAVTTALKMWHTFRTLELVYRDAYHSQLNDRYAGKRDQFVALGKWAFAKLLESGLGVVHNPIARAPMADLSYFTGPQSGAVYYVCVSWTGANGEEGAVGEWNAITVPENNVLSVRASHPPANAAGWNVFVGLSPDSICQQNSSPLALGQPWLQEASVSVTGRTPHTGQTEDALVAITNALQRG